MKLLLTLLSVLILPSWQSVLAQSTAQSAAVTIDEKQAYIPSKVWRVPDDNDYSDPNSEYSNDRRVESANIIIFWAKEYGADPTKNIDLNKRFDPEELLKTSEELYRFYTEELKFVEVGKSVSDRYKLLMYVFGGDDGTAYGGGAEDKIGVLWTPAVRVAKPPYGALAHEMGHSFQYLAKCDGNWAFSSPPKGSRGNSIFEMTSQYMLWQVYPDWVTFENYHLKGFMEKTHYAFLHETNQYHSPFVLEYWAHKHGIDFIGKMWRSVKEGEDPVMAYQRLTNIAQEAFNDELFDAYRRFVTWDLPRVESAAKPYANQHSSLLLDEGSGIWRVAPSHTPQDYGYNAFRLTLPQKSSTVSLRFEGLKNAVGYRAIQPERAGWRYGFLAVSKAGKRTYGDIQHHPQSNVKFKVPKDTEYLWFIVMGAPSTHAIHLVDGKDETDEQWPYQVTLNNVSLFDKK